jgi:predicted TIM-barrel fold metal-dependent hydrolase
MIGDAVIVDAVVHPYDLAPDNQNPEARAQLDAVYAAHRIATDPERPHFMLSEEEFFSDFGYDALAHAEFVEAPVDYAMIHALPNLGFALRHVTDPDRGAAFRDLHPQRLGLYATVDTPVVESAIRQLERQVTQLGVDGLKLYPAFFYDGLGAGWRLDGDDFATPLLEAAYDLGIRNVAVHKALWLPPAPRDAFDVDDVDAIGRFPEMRFQIVHAGTAFLDETLALLLAHPNLHLTLETTFQYILVKPHVFAKVLATLLTAGSERLLFASGNNLMHPLPLIEAFDGYELPEEVLDAVGVAQLTEQDRRNILGENALRLYGMNRDALLEATAGDAFAAARAAAREPWSALR